MEHAVDFLLLGGGIASVSAAETLRAEGASGSILLLSNEAVAPYQRPPLSKWPITEEPIAPPHFYRDHGIDLRLNQTVTAVAPDLHSVHVSDGSQLKYRRLLIATGATAKRLECTGTDLDGIHTLRSHSDAIRLHNDAHTARQVIILGGGFLGMEVAYSLARTERSITLIEQAESVLPALAAPVLSAWFARHSAQRGLTLRLNDTIQSCHGDQGRICAVTTASGVTLPCDLLILCIGVAPASDFLTGSGIVRDNGYIVVDELLRTSAADVFAAGDVTAFFDPVFNCQRHIEHWDNAVKQGQLAARNMLGQRRRYDAVSYFSCTLDDISFNLLGAPEQGPDQISRGDLDQHSFSLFYLRDGIARALFSCGRPADETRLTEGLIRHRVNLTPISDRLADADFPLDGVATQTVLVLQGGGALGAFECGVVKALEEQKIFPDVVAGISIGAFNGAIIASHPRNATQALESFWADLAVLTPAFPLACSAQVAAAAQILTFGVPNFFTPRWLPSLDSLPQWPTQWISYYDPTPMRRLIARYVDFPALKRSPVRLLISAVDVATAELAIFDSYVDELTPDHLLASGSLPPGFPWTEIDGKAYWDGGIISNSPLDLVIERCGPDGKRIYMVDLFANKSPLPTNLVEVMLRRDEIIYAERVRNDLHSRETTNAYRKLIDQILAHVPPDDAARLRQQPNFVQLMGNGASSTVIRFQSTSNGRKSAIRDFDFSSDAIRNNQKEGYEVGRSVLSHTVIEEKFP